MSASGTPFPFSRTPTHNSTNILSYSAFITPSTPVTPTPCSTNRGRKRKEKENLLPTHIPQKKAKIDLTDLEKAQRLTLDRLALSTVSPLMALAVNPSF